MIKMNIIIIHGSNYKDRERIKKYNLLPQNKRHWISWIKEKLEEKEINCFTPLMPKNWAPVYGEWKKEFEKLPVNEGNILIGHSTGGGFLVRWLGETKKKIKKLILVAPAKLTMVGYDYFKEVVNFEIDETIKKRVGEIILFTSNNDDEMILESVKLYHEKLGGKLIELKGRGHFLEKQMRTKEFPELLEEILK